MMTAARPEPSTSAGSSRCRKFSHRVLEDRHEPGRGQAAGSRSRQAEDRHQPEPEVAAPTGRAARSRWRPTRPGRPRRTAATTPAPTPMSDARSAIANTDSCSVTGSAWRDARRDRQPGPRSSGRGRRAAALPRSARTAPAPAGPARTCCRIARQRLRVALLAGQRPGRVAGQRPDAEEDHDRHQDERDHADSTSRAAYRRIGSRRAMARGASRGEAARPNRSRPSP